MHCETPCLLRSCAAGGRACLRSGRTQTLARRDAVPPTCLQTYTIFLKFLDFQGRVSRKAAKNAKKQARTTNQSVLVCERPWQMITATDKHGLAQTTNQSVLVCERPWQKNNGHGQARSCTDNFQSVSVCERPWQKNNSHGQARTFTDDFPSVLACVRPRQTNA